MGGAAAPPYQKITAAAGNGGRFFARRLSGTGSHRQRAAKCRLDKNLRPKHTQSHENG